MFHHSTLLHLHSIAQSEGGAFLMVKYWDQNSLRCLSCDADHERQYPPKAYIDERHACGVYSFPMC